MEFDPSDLIDEPSKVFDPYLFEVQPLMVNMEKNSCFIAGWPIWNATHGTIHGMNNAEFIFMNVPSMALALFFHT